MSSWTKTKEKLPEPNTPVIGFDSYYGLVRVANRKTERQNYLEFIDTDDDCNIILWQPLPENPTEKEIEDAK